jgi:hypothetical protein
MSYLEMIEVFGATYHCLHIFRCLENVQSSSSTIFDAHQQEPESDTSIAGPRLRSGAVFTSHAITNMLGYLLNDEVSWDSSLIDKRSRGDADLEEMDLGLDTIRGMKQLQSPLEFATALQSIFGLLDLTGSSTLVS